MVEERKTWMSEAEIALRLSEERFSRAFHANPVAQAIISCKDLRFLDVNRSFEDMLGYSRGEIIGRTTTELQFMVEQETQPQRSLAEREEPRQIRYEYHTKSGQARMGLGSAIIIQFGDEQCLLTSTLDVTERLFAEEELKKYREHLEEIVDARTAALQEVNSMLQLEIAERSRIAEARGRLVDIIETTPDFIITADMGGCIMYCNKAARQMLGIGEREHVSRFRIPDIHPGWANKIIQEEAIPTAVRDGIWKGETALFNRDGREIPVSQVLIVHQRPDGSASHLSTIARDISGRKQIEEQINRLNEDLERRAQELSAANKELEAFAYSVSHDLRAPLRSIHGFSQALLDEYADRLDEQGRDYLERLGASSQHMAQLIDDLLELSRITRSEMRRRRVDLSALARAIASELQKTQAGRRVEIVIQPGITAKGDSHLLQVMLANLLDNAWKFTSKQAESRIEFGVTRIRGKQAYYVRDNGAGFDMAYAGKLFGPFQRLHSQTEFPGTGVGLATVQRIVRRHGGEIWAVGEVGHGAVFYFTLS